ncbi:MAG: hypothetical protein HQ562_02560 [Candidatus Marinimicrobia bacterium]|nr:hypothetical protein [Candidatus Neomarinimicrobiota bacterium]
MLKRTTIIICSSLILILLITGFFYTYYIKISALPKWYTENDPDADIIPADTVVVETRLITDHSLIDVKPDPEPDEEISTIIIKLATESKQVRKIDQVETKPAEKEQSTITKQRKVPVKSARSVRQSVEKQIEPLEITAADIPNLIYDQLDRISSGQARRLLKAVRSNISPRVIEVELIVDVPRLQSLRNFSAPELNSIMQLVKTSNLNELYLRFDLIPVYRNDVITLKPESTIMIGEVMFDLRELETRFGIAVDQFQLAAPGFSKLKLQRGKIILN